MSIKDAYTTQELASIWGISRQGVDARAKREGWQARIRVGRGGGNEWLVTSMPDSTRETLLNAIPLENMVVPTVATSLPALLGTVELKALSKKDRDTVAARLAFVREIRRREVESCRGMAIGHLVSCAQNGTLPERLAGLIPYANSRYGSGENGRGLSRRRLYTWCAAYDEHGEAGLIPGGPQANMTPPAWLQLFLYFWQRPQKPSVNQAYDEFSGACRALLDGVNTGLPLLMEQTAMQRYALAVADEVRAGIPSVHVVRRWLAKMGKPEREAGRCTGNALLSLRPHMLRQTKDLLPTDVFTADGTTADAEVLHPDHGQPFKPELTFVLDVATRKCVGVSVGLAENRWTVLDALRMACVKYGIPAIFYTDNGPGYKNEMMDAEGVGLLDRLGTECANSIPGRPQGKGLMERAIQTLSRRLCKQFASCTDFMMDEDAAKKVFKLSRAEIKKSGSSRHHPTWEEFIKALQRRVEEYNAKPHSGLPRYRDEQGRFKRYSPNQYWAMFEEQGWEPVTVPEYLRDELFMPAAKRTVLNGWVRFYNAKYFAAELSDWHSEKVSVRYDIWDSSKVYIWTRDGRKICTARLDGNASPYFTPAVVERANKKRETAAIHRLEVKAQQIIPGATIARPEADSVVIDVADSLSGKRAPVYAQPQEELQQLREFTLPEVAHEAPRQSHRPVFTYAAERYEWLMRNRGLWTEADGTFVNKFVKTEQYKDFEPAYQSMGIAWEEGSQCVNFL